MSTLPEPLQAKIKAAVRDIVERQYIPLPEHMRPVKVNSEGYLYHVVIFNQDYTRTDYDRIRLRRPELDSEKLRQALEGWFKLVSRSEVDTSSLETSQSFMALRPLSCC